MIIIEANEPKAIELMVVILMVMLMLMMLTVVEVILFDLVEICKILG